MRYEDQVLLRDYSLMNLRIALAKNPGATVDIDEKTIRKSEGFIKLRAFFVSLSPIKRARFRRFMSAQLEGVRTLLARAKASGEPMTLADIEIEVFDGETREPVPDKPNVQLETATEGDA